ncbi:MULTISPECIES: flagellar basal body rod protein FlgB [Pseudomonas]|uniref:Flagellar basal body rod protein FlgB n=1 Tax=Pseudomonas kuykendallii TaxID=1007099 RepID=A0A2W5D6Z3_9PSED|nr:MULTISPECIES: flagellar basal body rod protein FlgB [Pseudomonas]MCQ4269813.1 flagellar basal body rod protein FlgB [Pseudomonas kuykendallii]PZP26228.1 MAG: flagellar basal body rod protein FlgB [Pseudomonas kuykendallii]SDX44754.1 flagellar basal-body rod protein FlgB [Pseudomonas kuykendallii]
MSISFDNALGIHEKALAFRAQRAEVLGNNLANADTPNYKARDLDFSAVLAEQADKMAKGGSSSNMPTLTTTSGRHIEAEGIAMTTTDASLRYRIPTQPSLDQNTVDEQVEQAAYAQNSLEFQASFTLLNSKFKGLIEAIRGE